METPWWKEGLRFKCTECGGCCTGAPGFTWVTIEEIETIAHHLNLSVEAFSKKYVRKVGERFSLLEKSGNYDCIFLKEKRCSIYPVRPTQCRTFPWWAQNLKTPEAWREAARSCEGISEDAPLVSAEEIEKQCHNLPPKP